MFLRKNKRGFNAESTGFPFFIYNFISLSLNSPVEKSMHILSQKNDRVVLLLTNSASAFCYNLTLQTGTARDGREAKTGGI